MVGLLFVEKTPLFVPLPGVIMAFDGMSGVLFALTIAPFCALMAVTFKKEPAPMLIWPPPVTLSGPVTVLAPEKVPMVPTPPVQTTPPVPLMKPLTGLFVPEKLKANVPLSSIMPELNVEIRPPTGLWLPLPN